jgi:L-seryl-tRNA(Ser) seleniumtransferase
MDKAAERDKLRSLPSVDAILRAAPGQAAVAQFGRQAVVGAARAVLAETRAGRGALGDACEAAALAAARLARDARPNLTPVFNLTGTVLHTNLGRALIAEVAIEAVVAVMRAAAALEFDIDDGRRGERDDHVRGLLRELTGAEDATVVNNNAAAILLVLNTFARNRDAIVSRGELIEIGGAFRMPEIMARAGARLVEVGTTNRTHARDYIEAIGARAALILKVHTSNYRIQGFTCDVFPRELATIAKGAGIPLVNDLGSGVLVDLGRFGLAREPTVAEAVAEGADLVTFSGDKLLGGPQAGIILGRAELIARLNRNPLKRTLRIDKIRLAALEATLRLYRNPDRLAETLPTMHLLARPRDDIMAQAKRVAPAIKAAAGASFTVEAAACASQVGSGALPMETIASAGVAIRPAGAPSGRALTALAARLRNLPIPVIGRIENGALVLDLRCLTDEPGFLGNLAHLEAAPDQKK